MSVPQNPTEQELNIALSSLVGNDHFLTFTNAVSDMRESAIFALCDPAVVKDNNLHFVATGEISAFDKITAMVEHHKLRKS